MLEVDNDEGDIKLYYQDFDLEALYGLYIIDFTIDTTVLKGFEVPIDHSNCSNHQFLDPFGNTKAKC